MRSNHSIWVFVVLSAHATSAFAFDPFYPDISTLLPDPEGFGYDPAYRGLAEYERYGVLGLDHSLPSSLYHFGLEDKAGSGHGSAFSDEPWLAADGFGPYPYGYWYPNPQMMQPPAGYPGSAAPASQPPGQYRGPNAQGELPATPQHGYPTNASRSVQPPQQMIGPNAQGELPIMPQPVFGGAYDTRPMTQYQYPAPVSDYFGQNYGGYDQGYYQQGGYGDTAIADSPPAMDLPGAYAPPEPGWYSADPGQPVYQQGQHLPQQPAPYGYPQEQQRQFDVERRAGYGSFAPPVPDSGLTRPDFSSSAPQSDQSNIYSDSHKSPNAAIWRPRVAE